MIVCKSKTELDLMREAGRIVALTHQELAKAIRPGITTQELDRIAEEFIRSHGAVPSFKGYHGYPASICASVNEELVHGIPGPRTLKDGDIISIDIGAYIHGFHGDSAWTYPVGTISDEAAKLLQVTEESLFKGIEQAIEGNRLSDIGHAVQKHVEAAGFSVVRDYVGHGIGSQMHEDPQIPNYGPPNKGPRLKVGMTLAIEPMVNVGTYHCKTLPDNWTVVTADQSLAAHFEHTVAITENGPEILTRL
ncbi:type I methionyl aminopeptidase [Effusibacillus lacus]|uniref:Methionine aminopeptidase n=1 Tax=Effusibacillus lacus TaxID=1348429 RepID=A0A292YK66_9BACL|nr:type I methionyl aminopeptidase [Effusibacillus lacus]TCS69195.1 methionine aminopeptidase type I [Effusibacillus lacus]GAX89299.1 type I methionyl aminopeptidase [Effusibacillus lacus]